MAKDTKARSRAKDSAPENEPSDAVKASRERMKSKYPTLFGQLEKLEDKRDRIREKTAGMRKRLEALQEKIQPLLAQERELAEEINKIERPTLGDTETEIAALYRAMGAVTVSASNSESADE
jgi:uncharacterized coiled-coil DUF342 family protein